jgi:hypothetical protein
MTRIESAQSQLMRIMMAHNRPTMSVPAAGKKYFGLGRNASYDAARRGEIPTMWIGSRIFAIVAALERKIENAGSELMNPLIFR